MTTLHLKMKPVSVLHLERAPLRDTVRRLVRLLGNNQTAGVLGVSPSQVSRWLGGKGIGPDSARRIVDFEFVFERAMQTFFPDEAAAFFTFPQPFLNGARPIDVLVTRGVGPIIEALDQIDQGAFA